MMRCVEFKFGFVKFLPRKNFQKIYLRSNCFISHISDIEGNGEKFRKIVKSTPGLDIGGMGNIMFTNSFDQFVFGGDAGDKGPNSFGILKSLTLFKSQQPSRVHLIVGNREAKMTRIKTELFDPLAVRNRLLTGKAVRWAPSFPPSSEVELVRRRQGLGHGSIADYIAGLSDKECQVIYLRWMLTHTMGCGPIKHGGSIDTFELFRQEIAHNRGVHTCIVSDTDVTQAVLNEVSPGGCYHKYLHSGVLAVRIGDTLFIHGAVTEANMGFVPKLSHTIPKLDDWVAELNGWYREQILLWDQSEPKSAETPPGRSDLIRYLVHNPRSVVTTNWYSHGKLKPLSDTVVGYLTAAGIRRVVSGHQPFSDCPLVIRHGDFEVIVNDTSMSDPTYELNNQGTAYSSLSIQQGNSSNNNSRSAAHLHVVRRTGKVQELDLSLPANKRLGQFSYSGDSVEGLIRLDSDGRWVVSQLDGYNVIDKLL